MPVSMFETEVVQYQTLYHPYQKARPEQKTSEISAYFSPLFIICCFLE